MKIRNLWCVLALVLTSCLVKNPTHEVAVADDAPTAKAQTDANPDVVATLQIAQTEPQPRVRLTVENRGQTAVRLLRLRPGWLEYNGGALHDWQIEITGPGGDYHFPWYTGWIPSLTERDFIELAPGEAFATTIYTAMATAPNGPNDAYKVGERDGTYNITVSRGTLVSNTLKFTVGNP